MRVAQDLAFLFDWITMTKTSDEPAWWHRVGPKLVGLMARLLGKVGNGQNETVETVG